MEANRPPSIWRVQEEGILLTGYRVKVERCAGDFRVSARFQAGDIPERWVYQNVVQTIPLPPSWRKYVGRPNAIERLLGITWEGKIGRAKLQVAKAAEREIKRHNQLVESQREVSQLCDLCPLV